MNNKLILLISMILSIVLSSSIVNAMNVYVWDWNLGAKPISWVEEDVLNPDSSFSVNLLIGIQYSDNYTQYANQLNFTIDATESTSEYNITQISVIGCQGISWGSGYGGGQISFNCTNGSHRFLPNVTLAGYNSYINTNTFLVSTEINNGIPYGIYYYLITYTIPDFPIDRGDYNYYIGSNANVNPPIDNSQISRDIFLNSSDFVPINIPQNVTVVVWHRINNPRILYWSLSSKQMGFSQFTFEKASEITQEIPKYWALYGAIVGAVIGGTISLLFTLIVPRDWNIRDFIHWLRKKVREFKSENEFL